MYTNHYKNKVYYMILVLAFRFVKYVNSIFKVIKNLLNSNNTMHNNYYYNYY